MLEKRIEPKPKSEETGDVKGIKDTAKEMLKIFYARIGRIIKSEKDIEESEEIKDIITSELEPKPIEEDVTIPEIKPELIIDEVEDKERKVEGDFPDSVEDINLTEYLGGSSDVMAGYFNGELLVVKKARAITGETGVEQFNTGQIIDEYIADRIYEAMGFGVSDSKIYDDGRYKIAKFIPGKDLNTFSKSQPEFEKIKKEVQKGFVMDCLLANWDVIGTAGGDNIRLGDDGKVYRLDNGGALRFRARGERKGIDFGYKVSELNSLRASNEMFLDVSDDEIIKQINEILRNYEMIFSAISIAGQDIGLSGYALKEIKDIIELRIDDIERYSKILKKKIEKEKEEKTYKGTYESAVTNNYFEDYDREVEIEGGNPEIKEQIRENIIQAEKRNQEKYALYAADLGVSVEQFKDGLQAKVEEMVDRSEFFRATQIDVLDSVMNVDGRWKSQFETGKSNGTLNQNYRAAQEIIMFGFNKNEAPKLTRKDIESGDFYDGDKVPKIVLEENKTRRPIYGYFSDDEHGGINYTNGKIPPPTNVYQYGVINFKIKKERALKKATITFQDSLGTGSDWPPTPAVKPHFSSFASGEGGNVLKKLKGNSSITNWGSRYTEVQYHGQLTMDDVESIHVSLNNGTDPHQIEEVRRIFNKYKSSHPESTIQLIEF